MKKEGWETVPPHKTAASDTWDPKFGVWRQDKLPERSVRDGYLVYVDITSSPFRSEGATIRGLNRFTPSSWLPKGLCQIARAPSSAILSLCGSANGATFGSMRS
uniref:Uncharacterized protein n=1 Tax=Coccidioides posadasii RMSCC 3488 TaxID=454284 RepID=A0A0J6FDH7_COCPO|nr:hypothetical protein CPAG_03655 [Coccidioides posadasii RMSCC 3488]